MHSLMEGSLDPDLLNREAGYGETSTFRFQHNDPDALNAGLHYLLLRCWRSRLMGAQLVIQWCYIRPIRRALQLLSDETTERSLEELAKACGVSKSYLCREFHQQIGVSFIRYRNSLRLSRLL
jgi:methylphosphotriester-DNA--protein-cysteine methyltransferase